MRALARKRLDKVMKNHIKHHRPPHVYLDNTNYIITVGTMEKIHYFNTDNKKELLKSTLFEAQKLFNFVLQAWTILNNHYHFLLLIRKSSDLPKIIQKINGKSSYVLNKLDREKGRQVWYSYWDTCIRKDRDFYTRFNYIHNNCVKHGYVKRVEDYPFSSYNLYLDTKGQDWLSSVWEQYPVVDFSERDDF